jgi:hypothetical protein
MAAFGNEWLPWSPFSVAAMLCSSDSRPVPTRPRWHAALHCWTWPEPPPLVTKLLSTRSSPAHLDAEVVLDAWGEPRDFEVVVRARVGGVKALQYQKSKKAPWRSGPNAFRS